MAIFDKTSTVDKPSYLATRNTNLDELCASDEAGLFCCASGKAPFDYDVHALYLSDYL
ncbi:MAG: hypothetical protein ABI658_14295 [Acidimicrobiales bacterium]